MKGVIYVEWDESAVSPKARYYGYGEIDGKRVRVDGDIDTASNNRRVRLVIRDRIAAPDEAAAERNGKP